ncbi:MAG TPA: hypothetical protein VEJ87_07105 [Acidimicrobiales bacterium]|nr:hypothetical protein [Acidimicrobiales bacterium]
MSFALGARPGFQLESPLGVPGVAAALELVASPVPDVALSPAVDNTSSKGLSESAASVDRDEDAATPVEQSTLPMQFSIELSTALIR